MPSFILRDIDPVFWQRVQSKAASEGITVKAMILRLLATWVSVIVFTVLGAGCAYQNPTFPTPVTVAPSTAPTSIRLTASSRPDFQTSVTATVYTADKHTVANIPIVFSSAAGTIVAQRATTDDNGAATAVVNTPTTTMVTASIGGAVSASVEIGGASAPSVPPSQPPPSPPDVPTGPPANFAMNAPPAGTTGVPIQFGVSANGGQTWAWTFGDGTSVSTSAYNVTHPYATAGMYTVAVSSAGSRGGSATITITDAPPPPPPPAAALTATLTCTPVAHGGASPCNVSASYSGTLLPSAAITNVVWDFGDGFTQTTAAPVNARAYVNAGSYTVFATVTATVPGVGSKTTTTSTAIVVP